MIHNLYIGIFIGLFTGMPLGPMGALGIKNTLSKGISYGVAVALGSCIADCIYASTAALGFSIIIHFLSSHQLHLRIFGGLVLIIFGLYNTLSPQEQTRNTTNSESEVSAFTSTLAIALANPATIFSFMIIFTSSGLSISLGHIGYKIALVFGVFCGGAFWWIIVLLSAGQLHNKLTLYHINWVNRILGIFITGFGLLLLLSVTNYRSIIGLVIMWKINGSNFHYPVL